MRKPSTSCSTGHRVNEGFSELVASQKELGQVTEEVETQLESLRKARAQLGVLSENKIEVVAAETRKISARISCQDVQG